MTPLKGIFLFGAGGQVGQAIVRICAAPDSVFRGLRIFPFSHAVCDISDVDAVNAAVRSVLDQTGWNGPDFVMLNAAAYTAVDKAEQEPDRAYRINVLGARVLAEVAAAHHIPFIHISTDYVFDGRKGAPYTEDDRAGPLSVYGRTKLEGENDALAAQPNSVIVRTSAVFGADGQNFLKTMLTLAKSHADLKVVEDQIVAPTYADDLAYALLQAARQVAEPAFQEWGVYHYGGGNPVTWYTFAQHIFKTGLDSGLCHSAPLLIPITSAQFDRPAARPAYSVLSSDRFKRVFGCAPSDWHAGVVKTVARLKQV